MSWGPVDANIRKLSEAIAHKCKLNKHVIIIIMMMFAVLVITGIFIHNVFQ